MTSNNWFEIAEPEVQWLVEGLFTSDGHAAIIGKPKAGKSLFLRNLIVAVVKGDRKFLDRTVDLPPGTGRVLYCHFDRKDRPWRVVKELKQLGLTREDAARLILRTAADMNASTFEERLHWLREEVTALKPHLVVIDLLWQFAVVKNSNDFNAVLDAINTLQDELQESGYQGALLVTIHSRKAVSNTDAYDDMLGSTAQRASFNTLVMLTKRRAEDIYTVSSDQTDRDDTLGEIEERAISRKRDGTLELGRFVRDLVKEQKKNRAEEDIQRLLGFIAARPNGCEMDDMMTGLSMSKKYAQRLLGEVRNIVTTTGKGVKGDPHRYYCDTGGPRLSPAGETGRNIQ